MLPRSEPSLLKLALAALASSGTTHALVAEPQRGVAFSVDAIAASSGHFNADAELERLQAKFPTEGPPPARRQTRADRRQQQQHGSAIAQAGGENGMTYFVPTIIGNQTFKMIFDTGSADLWVFSQDAPSFQHLEHPAYVPSPDSHHLPNYTWSIKYSGTTTVDGIVYTDTVKAGPLVATGQAVEAAVKAPYDIAADGILGLASGSINKVRPVPQKTLFETLLPTLQRRLFAANLRAWGSGGAPGSWDFGYLDTAKYRGEIAYSPVTQPFRHWAVMAGGYAVGGDSAPFGSATIGRAVVDSGSSLVYLPDEAVEAYYRRVEGHERSYGGVDMFPCNGTLPDFRFKVAGGTLVVRGADVNIDVADRMRNMCRGAIVSKRNLESSVLGNVFMKNYYVVHSLEDGHPTMGFASR